jgi:hypothetical protein
MLDLLLALVEPFGLRGVPAQQPGREPPLAVVVRSGGSRGSVRTGRGQAHRYSIDPIRGGLPIARVIR